MESRFSGAALRISGRIFSGRCFAVLLGALLFSPFSLDAETQHRLSLDNLVHSESIEDASLSPDGRWLVYVLTKMPEFPLDEPHTVWLVPVEGGTPREIGKGRPPGMEYQFPIWSPDSKRIAMVSITGAITRRLWIWDIESGSLQQPSQREVAFVGSYSRGGVRPPITWVSDRRLVCAMLSEGTAPEIGTERQTSELAMRVWSEAVTGKGSHASILESGPGVDPEEPPRVELVLIDLDKGIRPISSAAGFGGGDVRIASDLRHIAFLKQLSIVRPKRGPLGYNAAWQNGRILGLSVTNTDGSVVSVRSDLTGNVVRGSLAWSMDSREITYVRQSSDTAAFSPQVVRCEVSPWRCRIAFAAEATEKERGGGVPVTLQVLWAGKNALLVYAETPGTKETPGQGVRRDWWLLSPDEKPYNLTAELKETPSELFPESGRESVVGVAQGRLWRFWLDGKRQAEPLEPKVSSVEWPKMASALRQRGKAPSDKTANITELIVKAPRDGGGKENDFLQLDLTSGRAVRVNAPSSDAELIDYSFASGLGVFKGQDQAGSHLWLAKSGVETVKTVVETNTFLRDTAEGKTRVIAYRGLDGAELKAWLLLPPDFQEGRRCPLVTSVYPDLVYGDSPSFPLDGEGQLLAARGYCVLLPSMPLNPIGEPSDPYMELTKGVLPAVDKAIEIGIADPKRLAVMGHSFGGYSTYGLITQTTRFQAAVSRAGLADLLSVYGTFTSLSRYTDSPQEDMWHQRWLEFGQGRMGGPPWQDLARYLRNSPISYVDRVETPVLIIHGDMDSPAPIEQSEEFFAALYRQNKRAEFVRYWREGHALVGTDNIRDMWERIFAWFDEFMDISRDQQGELVWDGDKIKSRNGAPPLKPEDFARFDKIAPTGSGARSQ